MKLNIPKTFAATYDYKTGGHPIFEDLGKVTDEILRSSWAGKLTQGLPSTCIICQTTNGIEMHHLRKAADVRQKIKTGNAT